MYDNICKFIAENFADDFASWLLGTNSIILTELSPTELSLEPIRADALILRQAEDLVLHAEFQTGADARIPFRMADYRLRVYRRFPDKEMRQVVIYLRETGSDLVRQNAFVLTRTRHEFDVIRLWEQPAAMFLSAPGLLPFAVLSQTADPVGVLTQVASAIAQIPDRRVQSNLMASASILAGLVLETDVITRILRGDIMRESVIYQDILQEGEQKGLQKGRQEGMQLAKEELARNLLRENMTIEQVVRLTGLSLEIVQGFVEN
ncbi:MAG TPA: Rpn family recombination-promoting nuclease/putative transposase [Kamptonema sp.]|nr:Rpn family recombination-promoting nuclease/putative transposase [Kamptonema sp.]